MCLLVCRNAKQIFEFHFTSKSSLGYLNVCESLLFDSDKKLL